MTTTTRGDARSSRAVPSRNQVPAGDRSGSRPPRRTAVLLTGRPGTGKTTLIRRILASRQVEAGGFYTQELRTGGARKGFEIVTLDGRRGILAHVEFRGRHRVGRYGVDLHALETLGVSAVRRALEAGRVVVVDEIGPMELLSEEFRSAVHRALDSGVPVLGTIVRRSMPFTDQIKMRGDVQVIEVRPDNRDAVLDQVLAWLEGPQPGR